MKFRIFKQVPKLIFGKNSINRIQELLPEKKGNDYYVYVIDDYFKSKGLVNKSLNFENNDHIIYFPATKKEPTTDQIDDYKEIILKKYSNKLPIAIIGIGGGSSMDVAKAISVMLCNDGSAREYQGWDLPKNEGVYKVGIPTIAGSGSEASRTTVLMGKDRKFGINSDYSMFNAIILDSNLISSVPKNQRFYSGMDCYIHCVESLEGTMINELSKGIADKALSLCKDVFTKGLNNDMLITASYLGGVSIVNSEVGICHALSYGLSLELDYRHGYANCIVFNALEDYYGGHVKLFKKMLLDHDITLPKNVCSNLNDAAIERMVDMTLLMDRPLTNALGKNWREILTREKIRDLYLTM